MQFLVKRKGLDFTEYGLVDATAIKRQKLGGGDAAPTDAGHLCRAVLDEYAGWDASFKRSLESHKDGGNAIDLGEATVLCLWQSVWHMQLPECFGGQACSLLGCSCCCCCCCCECFCIAGC